MTSFRSFLFVSSAFSVVAMSLVESEAAFGQRCDEIVADGSLKRALVAQNVKCFSALAFAVGTPQSPPTETQFDAFAQQVFGAPPNLGQLSSLKRLHFESTTFVIAALKESVSSETADKVETRKIPLAEKKFRLEDQERRLGGLRIVGELNPSHHLLDLTNQILETGSIVWIAPSRCAKRDDEIQLAVREKPGTKVQVENAQLKIAPSGIDVKADFGSELKFQWCMQRRGIAMDQCRLLSWKVHEEWLTFLLNTLSREAPPGYQQVNLDQLIRADRELWTLLAQEVRGSLKPSAAGVIPLDAEVRKLATDPRVTMFILPLASSTKRPAFAGDDLADDGPDGGKKKNKKKSKTRAEKACPEELKNFNLKYEHGPICWAYNMKDGCKGKTSAPQGKPVRCNREVSMFAAIVTSQITLSWCVVH